MKNILFTLVLWLFTFTASAQQSWEVVGETGFPEDSGGGLVPEGGVLTLDNNGTPYVAYASFPEYNILVMKFENDNWQSVGDTLYMPGSTNSFISASLAFSSNNTPYFAYLDASPSYNVVTVKKLENGIWENVGTGSISSGWSGACVLAIDSNDIPYVFYAEGSDSKKATVKKFENDSWQVVGQAGFSIEQIRHTSMVFDDNNVPYVMYSDDGNDNNIYVKKFENGSWLPVGEDEAGIPVTTLSQNTLFIGSSNTPYIAYRSMIVLNPYVFKAVFKKYINNEWQQVGEFILEGSKSMSFGLYDDIPYIAYTDGENDDKATVIRLENDIWQTIGEEGFSEDIAYTVRLTINNNGVPYVAFNDYTNNQKLTVMKYDNTMGVDEPVASNDILLYPNPTNDVVTIDNITENSTIKIFDSIGKLVFDLQATNKQVTINTANLISGIYLVQVTDNHQKTIKKLVINR